MAFPQIGLEAVLQIDQFEKNARTYNRTLDGMDKKTKQASTAINKSTQKAANSAFDLTKRFREAAGGIDSATQSSAGRLAGLGAAFKTLAKPIAVVTAGIGAAVVAVGKLVQAGEEVAALEDIRQSFLALAASSGVSAEKLIGDLRTITRGTVDTATLIKTANTALLAGGAQLGEDLPKFLAIAGDAARTTGQDFAFVTETLIKGIVKGSPLLIDNAELYLDIAGAVEEYAVSVGKSVDELTRQERTIATGNAVLEQGTQAYAALGATTEAATDPFKQLKVQSDAFGTGLKTLVAPWITEVVAGLQGLLDGARKVTAGYIAMRNVQKELFKDLSKITDVADLFRAEFDRVFETLNTGIKPVEDIEGGITAIGDASDDSAKRIAEFNKKMTELAEQRGERLAKLELQSARRIEDIDIGRDRQLEDAARQLARRLEDTERQNARTREKIARDNAKRIADVERDNQNRRRALVQETQRAREDQERAHRENLFQINQKADDTIGEAARRNDAVAIAAALRQKEREIRDEQRGSALEKQAIERDLTLKQQRLDEDAALSLEKARQQNAQALADQQAAELEQEESLKLSLQRQEEDRNLAWTRQNEDLVRARERQLEDLDLWYEKEQEKLEANLKKQTEIAVEGVRGAGSAIARATTQAINTVSTAATGRTPEQAAVTQRGNFLGSEENLGSTGLSPEEQRLLRGSFLARAEGGVDVVNRPTAFLAGEAGPEIAAFIPLRNQNLNIGGSIGVDVNGAGTGGMDTSAIQQIVFSAMQLVARRISTAR